MNAIELPVLITEAEAWPKLGLRCRDTLERIRKRGEISYRKIGGEIKYTLADLLEYIERVKVVACNSNDNKADLVTSGSLNGAVARPGTLRGSTRTPVRHGASLAAQATFEKRKRN